MFNVSDIIVILIIALAAFLGYRKGFIKTSFRIVSFFVAIILSMVLYKPVAGYIKENTSFDEWIISSIMNEQDESNETIEGKISIEEKDADINELATEATTDEGIEQKENTKLEEVLANLPENVKDYIEADETINQAKEQIVIKITDTIINIVSMIGVYVVSKLVLAIVCLILDGVMQIPVLKQINEVAGLGLGVVLGIIQVYTILAVIAFMSSIVDVTSMVAYIKGSFIASILFEYNLLIMLIF